jgi:hypothetical protein
MPSYVAVVVQSHSAPFILPRPFEDDLVHRGIGFASYL